MNNRLAPPPTNALAPRSFAGFGQNVRTGLSDLGLGLVDAGKLLGEHVVSTLPIVGRPGQPTRLSTGVYNALANPAATGRAVLNHLGRYAPQNIGNTLYNDPVGAMMDLAPLGVAGVKMFPRAITTPEGYMAGKPGVYKGYRAATDKYPKGDVERLGGTYVAQGRELAEGYAGTWADVYKTRVKVKKPFVANEDNIKLLARVDVEHDPNPLTGEIAAEEIRALADNYREFGVQKIRPSTKKWLLDNGYDAVVAPFDFPSETGMDPVMLVLKPDNLQMKKIRRK